MTACSKSGRSGNVVTPGWTVTCMPEQLGGEGGGRRRAEVGPGDQRRRGPAPLDDRELGVVLEAGVAVAEVVGLCDPELHALQRPAVGAGALLGVHHATTRGHQVHLARADELLRAEAVAVQHGALHQPRDRLQAGVRVRADVEARGLGDLGRAHVVGEAPGADRAQACDAAARGAPASARPRP